MSAVALRRSGLLHPSLVVARFTLLSVLRRRWLTVTGVLGLVLLVIDGIYTKASDHVAAGSFEASVPHRLAEQVFRSSASLTAVVVGGISLVVAMSIIRDDLGTGAAELLLTKPLPRPWYALGKIATLATTVLSIAAVTALVRAGVLLVGMGDSAYVADSVLDTLAIAANAFVLGLVILAISSWGSSLAAGLMAAILLLMANATAPMMDAVAHQAIVGAQADAVRLGYYASPRLLSPAVDYYYVDQNRTCHPEPRGLVCTTDASAVKRTWGGSSALDVLAWAGYALGTMGIMLLGIRRFSGRLTE